MKLFISLSHLVDFHRIYVIIKLIINVGGKIMNLEQKELISGVVEEVKKAAEVYYQGDKTFMSDEDYDTKVELLESQLTEVEDDELIEAIKEVLNTVSAGSEPTGTVVIHDYPMLSLGKAKSYDELEKYHSKLVKAGAKGFILQMKLDGLALSAKYSGGKLIQLSTRGDGVKGESLSHLINHKEVDIVGLPLAVDSQENFEIRGELYITDNQFIKINKARYASVQEEFSNSRNAAVGITRRSMGKLGYKAQLSFTAYSAHKNGDLVEFSSVDTSKTSKVVDLTEGEVKRVSTDELKLKSCTINTKDYDSLKEAVEIFGKLRENFGIPTDGVVIKPINEIEMLNKMGYTSRFPIAYIAFKYPGAKAITEVLEIVVSVGKTGRLTPQAKVNPVEVDGVVISNITCHNYSWLNEMGIRPGAIVSVTRANDVIPAIDSVVNTGKQDPLKAPKNCPECNAKLQGDGSAYPKTLTCENLECPSRLLYYMKSIVGRNFLYIEGLGDVALKALVSQGVLKSVVDLFDLKEDVLAKTPTGETSTGNVRNLGEGNAKNIMESIKNAKENTDSNKLLAALNIPGMGPNTAKRLIAHFGGIKEVLEISPENLLEVPQSGDSLVNAFKIHQAGALEKFNELVKLGVKVNDPIKKGEVEFKGTFSVSGSVEGFDNRDTFVTHMESLGWEFHKSPKKDTNVLFADPSGTSSKIKKAKANGTRILDNLNDL